MRPFYGWVIVGVALLSMAFWFGIRSSFSIFYVALLEEFRWGRGEAAGVQSMAMLVYTFVAPAAGGLIDRFGPRRVVGPGILILALGLFLCSRIQSLAQFYVFYGLMVAVGVTAIAIVSYTAILAHWFERRRGTANGIAVSGMGLGTMAFALLCQEVIASWGWRPAFAILAALVLGILLPVNLVLLRHKPQDMGLVPDGAPRQGARGGRGRWRIVDAGWRETDWRLGRVLGEPRFWALLAFPFMAVMAVYTVLVHHVRFLVDQGMSPAAAAGVLALAGIITSVFRILWGWGLDHVGRERTYSLGAVILASGISVLILREGRDSSLLVYLFAILFGMGWAVTAPTFMSTAADLFQGRSFGLIYGMVEGVLGAGAALGSWLAGYLFDRTQTYRWAFALAAAAAGLSCICLWLAAPRKVVAIGKE